MNKKIVCVLGAILILAIAGCEDMKMDKNVAKKISLGL